jgi:hypothetical protein
MVACQARSFKGVDLGYSEGIEAFSPGLPRMLSGLPWTNHRAKGINPELKNKKAGSGFHRTPP